MFEIKMSGPLVLVEQELQSFKLVLTNASVPFKGAMLRVESYASKVKTVDVGIQDTSK